MNCKYRIEDNRLHLSCTCDGTLWFLEEMCRYLVQHDFEDIQYSDHIVGIDHEPWIRTQFECSGIFTDDNLRTQLEAQLDVSDTLHIDRVIECEDGTTIHVYMF